MMQFRQPTRHDIGRTVEVEIQNDFFEAVLLAIGHERTYTRYVYRFPESDDDDTDEAYEAHVPIDPTSAADQLAVAADYHEGTIVEQVLRVASQMDAATLQKLLLYQPGMALIVGRFRGYDLHIANHAARRDITEGTTAKDVTP